MIALASHAILWVALVNRLHGIAFSHKTIDLIGSIFYAAMGIIGISVAWWVYRGGEGVPTSWASAFDAVHLYLALCIVVAVVHLPRWLGYRLRPKLPKSVTHHN